ncbi:MAG: hypothetical protein HXY37_15960 [Chloroflexi bacterium]|nr:hypothetical protein [Chloroflexota bacterium]
MELVATLLLIGCYGAAAYLAWVAGTPIYLVALAAGHVSALASPLWRVLYGVNYNLDLATVQILLGQPVPLQVLLGAGWYYPLPALVVYYLYTTRWWFPNAITGVVTYMVFLLCYLLVESFGLRAQVWAYNASRLPPGFTAPLLAAIMSALIAYGLLYVLLAVQRSTWPSMLLAILPAPLLLSVLVHGLLGAPLWLALLLNGQPWVVLAGLVSTLVLLAWAVQIITSGIKRLAA